LIAKRILILTAMCIWSLAAVRAKEAPRGIDLLRQASFSIETDGAVFNFILLTDKTIDALFSGPSKLSIRARANASTTFFVQGRVKKRHNFSPDFEVVQNGQSIQTKITSIKNFKEGLVDKGDKIEGLVQLVHNLNLYQSFHISDTRKSYPEFQYNFDAVEAIKN
jgi:hypothetical protein